MDLVWQITERIGIGSFGAVYGGLDEDGNFYAIKRELFDCLLETSVLREYEIINRIHDNLFSMHNTLISIPYPVFYGESHGDRYLVMPRLGKNLHQLQLSTRSNRFPTKTVFQVGYQILEILRHVHSAGYVHLDLKPENMLIGFLPTERSKIYLCDFGLAKEFRDRNGDLLQQKKCESQGNENFMALNTLQGRTPGPKEDLESLGYVLVWMLYNELPWISLSQNDESISNRSRMNSSEGRKLLCKNESTLMEYFSIVDKLEWGNIPPYENLRKVFSKAIEKKFHEYVTDQIDWNGSSNMNVLSKRDEDKNVDDEIPEEIGSEDELVYQRLLNEGLKFDSTDY